MSDKTDKTNQFFTTDKCDRCHKPLTSRIMSWFTDDTICHDCSTIEREIKNKLREKGIPDAMEGCGFIPNVD